jgi:hypothetical protein
MYSGYAVVGYFWPIITVLSQQKLDEGNSDTNFYQAKIHIEKFYFDRMLTGTRSLVSTIDSALKI